MALVNVSHLTFSYPLSTTSAIEDISFSVEKGEFIVVCGATGSGKSTLLRLLKREIAPRGEMRGEIDLLGMPRDSLSEHDAACRIGYVMQRPEQQIVTDKVWHELAFGLENINTPRHVIAARVAEIAAYFDMESWYEKDVSALSGGQKQLLNLAAVMVMQPEILILDEPTAQLDPIAASAFIDTVVKLNRETGITVIMTEHRLEEIVPVCDKLLVLKDGRRVIYDEPGAAVGVLLKDEQLRWAMPSVARLWHRIEGAGDCPLTVRAGRLWLDQVHRGKYASLPQEACECGNMPALEMKDVYFRYEKQGVDVLRGLNLTIYENEICCVLGGNGSGKTTMLGVASGLLKAYSGNVRVFSKKLKEYRNQSLYRECLTMLPQDVQTVFLCNTVREELKDAGTGESLLPFDLTRFYDRHPYDLSGGEQQLVALAKVLATNPKLLLLDEPTKGIDAASRIKLIDILKQLKQRGMTIVIVTHDVEFAAMCADRCMMFFRGDVVSMGTPRTFFSGNSYYTTPVSRMTRNHFENAVTVEDAAVLLETSVQKGTDI